MWPQMYSGVQYYFLAGRRRRRNHIDRGDNVYGGYTNRYPPLMFFRKGKGGLKNAQEEGPRTQIGRAIPPEGGLLSITILYGRERRCH